MKVAVCISLFLWVCACAEPRLTDEEIRQRIDTFVDRVRECSGVPGITLGVVKDGQAFYSTGYGLADITKNTPVSNKTMFLIASNTKAFLGTLLAKLINQSSTVTWQTKIRDIVGDWFYFKDAYRSQHVNLEDAVTHRAGFPRVDTIRNYGFTIREYMERLRFFDEENEFRTTFSYNNMMYGVAQYAAEVIGGKSWEELTNELLFQPIGMTSSTFIHKARDRWPEFATAYMNNGSSLRTVSLEAISSYYQTIGSPGSISSNSEDMTKWLMFHINGGRNAAGVQVVNESALDNSYSAWMNYPASDGFYKPNFPAQHSFNRYGAGWELGYYRGYKSVMHYGGNGFYSVSVFVKDLRMGVYMSLNTDSNVRRFVPFYVMDLLQGVEPWINETTVCTSIAEKNNRDHDDYRELGDFIRSNHHARPQPESANPDSNNDSPTLYQTMEGYVGVYGHYGYGNVSVYINESTGGLVLSYGPTLKFSLQSTGVGDVFDGQGQEPFWYWNLAPVTFRKSSGAVYDIADIPFDGAEPPASTFRRDLKQHTAPPPPELCP